MHRLAAALDRAGVTFAVRTALVAVTAAAALTPAAPASATALTWQLGVVRGSGTISPPGTAVPGPATLSFSGTFTLLVPEPCVMSGPAAFESMEAGSGVLSGTCGSVPMSCLYERAGVAMTWQCTTTTVGVLAGEFVLRPHDVNPMSSFDLVGVLGGATYV